MKRIGKPLLFVCLGVLLAFPLFSLTYYTMVRTSTPLFCASCHEIQPAYNAWRTSSHTNNSRGVVADCMDCHLPAPHDTYDFFFAKTMHGIKDVIAHFTEDQTRYDHALNRARAARDIKNDQCLKCHRNLLYLPRKQGGMLAHRQVLYPRPGYEKRCTDCHQNLVHVQRPYYRYLPCDSTGG